MRNIGVKILFGWSLLAMFATTAFGQAAVIEQGDPMFIELHKSQVPGSVKTNHANEFPKTTDEVWHGYPEFSNSADWYAYDSSKYTNKTPKNYIVSFNKDNVPYKVIYAKNGKKIATHRAFVSDLPKPVSVALSKSKYMEWTLIREKVEIIRAADKMKIYRLTLANGKEKHVLFYGSDGKLLKDMKVKS